MSTRGLERRSRQAALFALFFAACVAFALLANPSLEASRATSSSPEEPRIGISDAVVAAGEVAADEEAEEVVPSEDAEAGMPPQGPGSPPSPELEEAPEELEREEALATPEAAAERETSRYAYTNLLPEQAEELLRQRFADQLQQIDADPSRALSDVVEEEVSSPTEALVSIEGEKALLESSVPLRAPDESGDLAKIDLGLEEIGSGYSPGNSLVELSLPKTAAEPIQVGEVGVSVATERAAASTARRFGDEDLYLPDVAEDTDLLLSPITGGVEVSALVLSRNSPEQIPLAVTMPPGATLRPAANGGAEVIDLAKKKTLATIGVPYAWDAQGTALPAALSVKGNSVSLDFMHRSMDIAYPAFVDPEIEENWSGFADTSKLNYWSWQWYGVGPEDYIGWRSCIVTCWGNGLYVRSRSNFTYPGGSWGRWWFVPQGSTTYMRRVILGPMNYDPHGCTANEPHPFVGVWNDGGWWSVLSNAYPSGWGNWIDTGEQNLGPGTRTALVGISAASSANINCGHDYRLGGAVLYLNDPENPNVGTPTGQPTKWIKDKESFTLNVPVGDPGLGVKSATISPKDSPPLSTQTLGCSGHYNSQCPISHTFQFTIEADSFDQGEKEVRVSATDAMTKGSNTQSFFMKVDRTSPDVTLAGQLATATDEAEGEANDNSGVDALKLPVYNLEIKATDGSNASASTRRSGVKSIEVFLDEKLTPEKSWTQSSCNNSCGMTQTYTLKLNELTALKEHKLRVVVKDHAGNIPRERKIEFEYVPATGMKEEYVLHHFPLPNGQGSEAEEENPIRPELAVNVMNGNLVYRELDLEVSGAAADLEVERYYNSLLPESQDTEWGDGWTLAQTPSLEVDQPKSANPTEATLVEESGAVDSKVGLPKETGEEIFDETLQAVVSKEPGGYAITDESGEAEGTLAFGAAGETNELRTPGYAEIDYSYEGGELAEIAVDDPGATDLTVAEAEEWEEAQESPAFEDSFGSYGTGPGQFDYAGDIGQTSTGDFWVADPYNHRIQKLDDEGNQLDVITKAGDGKQLMPNGLTVDGQDNVLITDSDRHLVEVFNANGDFVRRFGGGWGTAQGQFRHPQGLAIDPQGDVLVADMLNGRLQEFSATGTFKRVVGTEGSGPGQIQGPADVAVAPDGTIWVADFEESEIEVLKADGTFVRSFGTSGSADGQFASPVAIAVGAKGAVWVADMGNGRVQQFDSQGAFVRSFGSKGSGDGQFQFGWPVGIVADGEGNLWVTDGHNDRVQKWAIPSEEVVLPYGEFGSYGTGPGQFDYAGDIGQTSTGDFWVADPYNHRIQKLDDEGNQLDVITKAGDGKQLMPNGLTVDGQDNVLITDSDRHLVEVFNANGDFVRRFGGGWGTAQGQFRHPQGLAIDPQGDVLVADMLNGRLQEFSATGTFKRVVGTEGSGPGQIQGPADVAVAPDGTIWVADFEESDIEVLKADGTFVRSFGTSGSADGQFASPVAIAVGAKGAVWVADMGNGRVQQFDSQGAFVRSFGSKGSGDGQFQFGWPVGIVADGEGNLWVTDGHNDRVQKWAIPSEEVVLPYGEFGSYGTGPGQFDYAGDIGQTSTGDFWVADPYNHRIQKLDDEGNQLDVITKAGDGKQLMPNGLTVDGQDNVLITDSDRHLVEVFNANGDFVRRFGGGWGTAQGQFRHPQGLAIDPQGDVLVADMLNGRLQEFSATGTFKRVVGTEGSGPGQIQGPADVAVAPDGTIWVADFEESEIEVLKADGTFVRSFGTSGSADGQFASPVAIAVGAKGAVWVADMGNGRVQQFDSQGAFVRSFGSKGSGDGQFQFGWPVGIVADGEGNLWVTDGHNDRVQWWRLGWSRAPGSEAVQQDDPAVEVETSNGLVNVVEGEEAGLHLYAHSGDLLTAHGSAEGTTQYAYDGNGRMTKVTLPNGTYGEIAYEASYGRVISVAVAIEGKNPQT